MQETLLDLDVQQLITFVGGLKDAAAAAVGSATIPNSAEAESIRRKSKRPAAQRRRPRRRKSPATSPCRSSLADKASDYEDIWGTSPPEEIPAPIYPLNDPMDELNDSSSNSTLEKITSGGAESLPAEPVSLPDAPASTGEFQIRNSAILPD